MLPGPIYAQCEPIHLQCGPIHSQPTPIHVQSGSIYFHLSRCIRDMDQCIRNLDRRITFYYVLAEPKVERDILLAMGFSKLVNKKDEQEAAAAGLLSKPLTQPGVDWQLLRRIFEQRFSPGQQGGLPKLLGLVRIYIDCYGLTCVYVEVMRIEK